MVKNLFCVWRRKWKSIQNFLSVWACWINPWAELVPRRFGAAAVRSCSAAGAQTPHSGSRAVLATLFWGWSCVSKLLFSCASVSISAVRVILCVYLNLILDAIDKPFCVGPVTQELCHWTLLPLQVPNQEQWRTGAALSEILRLTKEEPLQHITCEKNFLWAR